MANSILWEYGFAIGVSVFLWFVLPAIVTFIMNLEDKKDYKGFDGLGQAIIILFTYFGLNVVPAALFLAVKPIRILIKYRQDIAEMMPFGGRIGMSLSPGMAGGRPLISIIPFWFCHKKAGNYSMHPLRIVRRGVHMAGKWISPSIRTIILSAKFFLLTGISMI